MQSSDNTNPKQLVFVMQIISSSLMLGIAMFMGAALAITQGQQPKTPQITYIALGYAGLSIVGCFLFRLSIKTTLLKQINQQHEFDPQSDEVFSALAPTYQTEHIVKMGILEGAAFFNGVAYMTEQFWWSLAAMGLIELLMLFRFPTRSKITAWIERKTLNLQFGDSDF